MDVIAQRLTLYVYLRRTPARCALADGIREQKPVVGMREVDARQGWKLGCDRAKLHERSETRYIHSNNFRIKQTKGSCETCFMGLAQVEENRWYHTPCDTKVLD